MASKQELKPIPGFSEGVNLNSALRMITLAQPICPNSRIEMVKDSNGNLVRKEKGPDQQNCQLAGPGWQKACEEKGHNPYFNTRVWYTTEDILETDAEGRLIKKGEQYIKHEVTQPNLTQVAVTVRINQGKGAVDAIEKKGFKRLKDVGYQEVCQLRNCQRPVSPRGTSRKFGAYCSLEHLQVVAADEQGIALTQGALLPSDAPRARQKREHQLREISVGVNE